MKRHFVVVPNERGEPEPHLMKDWLRRNPAEVPEGLDPDLLTSHRLRSGLRRSGWRVEIGESEVRLISPRLIRGSDGGRAESPGRQPDRAGSPMRERDWVHRLVPLLASQLKERSPELAIRDGYRLAYSREVLSYHGDEAREETGMRYETDLLVVEQVGDAWTPRVVVEAKLGTVTTHDAITYSQKAATHKHVHPYLRYGIFLGGRKHHPLPGRLFRHGAHFDFMLSWRELEPTPKELTTLVLLLEEEVAASRLLQGIMFNTRGRGRAAYSFLHRPVVAW